MSSDAPLHPAHATVFDFEDLRAYLDEHDPEGECNLWGFMLPWLAKQAERTWDMKTMEVTVSGSSNG